MYCPQCRAEYRPGFTHCTDCDVDLVEELTSRAPSEEASDGEIYSPGAIEDGEELRMIWEGDDSRECANACRELQRADIPYRVSQSVAGRFIKMEVDWSYQVNVRAADYTKARKVLGYMDEASEEAIKRAEANGSLELPADDDKPIEDVRGDWNPPGWFPEDATVEVWQGTPEDNGSLVEMSLKENRITYHVALDPDGMKKVFVMPENEIKAREIVREVVEGAPPE